MKKSIFFAALAFAVFSQSNAFAQTTEVAPVNSAATSLKMPQPVPVPVKTQGALGAQSVNSKIIALPAAHMRSVQSSAQSTEMIKAQHAKISAQHVASSATLLKSSATPVRVAHPKLELTTPTTPNIKTAAQAKSVQTGG